MATPGSKAFGNPDVVVEPGQVNQICPRVGVKIIDDRGIESLKIVWVG